MIESLAKSAQPLLDNPYIRRVRRNHGLEHATVHMLSHHLGNLSMAGRSDGGGFWLMGELETSQVEQAANEALRRLQNGEHQLAVHPNCGTSLMTTSAMVGLAALTGSFGVRRGALDYFSRLPTVILLALVAILASRSVGLKLQEHFTTLGDPGDLQIVRVERRQTKGIFGRPVTLHRISTVSS
jgi:hypothetical protein